MKIKDPGIWVFQYFSRFEPLAKKEEEADITELWEKFRNYVVKWGDWLGQPVDIGKEVPKEETYRETLFSIRESDGEGGKRYFAAGVLLDSFFVQAGAEKGGDFSREDLGAINSWLPEIKKTSDFLGEIHLITGEVTEMEKLGEIARSVAETWFGEHQGERTELKRIDIRSARLPFASLFLALVPKTEEELWLLFWEEETAPGLSRFLYRDLVEAFLSRAKLLYYREGFPRLRAKIRNSKKKLLELLEKPFKGLSLKEIENFEESIMEITDPLADQANALESGIHTLQINRGNLEIISSREHLGQSHNLSEILSTGFNYLINQMEADFRYIRSMQKRANSRMESLKLKIEIKRAQIERLITSILGGFAVFETVDLAFPTLQKILPYLPETERFWLALLSGALAYLVFLNMERKAGKRKNEENRRINKWKNGTNTLENT